MIEYLKAGLHQSLFKSIYQLPVMPTTLDSWYEWAFKLDGQYHQEQAELRLLHPSSHVGSKFGKSSGSSSEKGKSDAGTEGTVIGHGGDTSESGFDTHIRCNGCRSSREVSPNQMF